ncbi:RNA-binding protein 44 [Discoglossus pictus]
MTINIPLQTVSETSGITTSVRSSKAAPITTAKASFVDPSMTSSRSASLAPKSVDSVSQLPHFPCDEEDSAVYPRLDLTTEHPTYIPPHTMNLSSFSKLMKHLIALHPEASRDHIIKVLQEIRISRGGTLSGLPISTIVRKASYILKQTMCRGPEAGRAAKKDY